MTTKISNNNSLAIYRILETLSDRAHSVDGYSASHHCEEPQPLLAMCDPLKEQWTGFKECLWSIISHLDGDTSIFELFVELPDIGTRDELKEARRNLFSLLDKLSLDDSVLNTLQGSLKKPQCLEFSLIHLPILKRALALKIEELKEKSPPFRVAPLCIELAELSNDPLFSVLILMHAAKEVQDSKEGIKILLDKAQEIYKRAQQIDSPQLFDIKLSLLRFPNFAELKLGEHGFKPIQFKNYLNSLTTWSGPANLPLTQIFLQSFAESLDYIPDLKKRNEIFEICLRVSNEPAFITITSGLIPRFTDPYFKFCALQSYLQFWRYLSTKGGFDPFWNARIASELESMSEDLLSEAIDTACQSPTTKERHWKLLQLANRLFHFSRDGAPFQLSAAPSEDFDWSDLRIRQAWLNGLTPSTHDCIRDLENITPRLELIFNHLSNKKLAHFCRQTMSLMNYECEYPNPPESDLAEDPTVDLLARLSFCQLDKYEDEELKEHLAAFNAYKATDAGFDIFLTALVETSWDCAIERRNTLIETVNKKLALERDANLISKTILNLIHIAKSADSKWWPEEAHNALNHQALELAALLEEDERSRMTDLIYQKSILLPRSNKNWLNIAKKALERNDYQTPLKIYRERGGSTAILKLILPKPFEKLPNLPDLEIYQIVCAIADEMHKGLNLNCVLFEQGAQFSFSMRDPTLQSKALARLIIRACVSRQTFANEHPSYFIKLAEGVPDLSIRETLMKRLAHFFVKEVGSSEWTKGFSLGFLSELFMKHPVMIFPAIKEHLGQCKSISGQEKFWLLFAETAYDLKDDAAISTFFECLSLEKNSDLMHNCLQSKKIEWQRVADQALKEPINDFDRDFWMAVIHAAYSSHAYDYLAQIADQLEQKSSPLITVSFLRLAGSKRDTKSIKALVNSGADINIDQVGDHKFLETILEVALSTGATLDFIVFLLFMGAIPRSQTFRLKCARTQLVFPLLLMTLENHSLESRQAILTPALAKLAEKERFTDEIKGLCQTLIAHGANANYFSSSYTGDLGTLLYKGFANEAPHLVANAIQLGVDPHVSEDKAPNLLKLIGTRLAYPSMAFLKLLDQLVSYEKFEVNTAIAFQGTFITLLDLFYLFRTKIPEALIAKLEARNGFTFYAYREILAAETAEIPVESPYYPILEQLKACRAHLGWKEGDPIDCPLNVDSKGVIAVEQVGEIDIMDPRSKPRSKYEYISWFIQGLAQLQKYQRLLWASNNRSGILSNPASDYGHKISGLLLHFESGTTGDGGYSVKEGYHILLKAYQMTLEANFPDGVLSFFEYGFNSFNPCLQARVEKLNEYIDSFHNEFMLIIDRNQPPQQRLITYGRHLQYNAIRTVALEHNLPYLRLKQWLLDHESGMLEIEKDLRLTDEQKKERLALYHQYRSYFTLEKLQQLIAENGEDSALLKGQEAFCILTNFNLLPAGVY